ncbi:MAG: hypothetical protein U1E52_20430 [Geminicoccaceae bacterium]
MTKHYRSKPMASIHATAEGLQAADVLDEQTMRRFNEACLTPVHPPSAVRRGDPGIARAKARRKSVVLA